MNVICVYRVVLWNWMRGMCGGMSVSKKIEQWSNVKFLIKLWKSRAKSNIVLSTQCTVKICWSLQWFTSGWSASRKGVKTLAMTRGVATFLPCLLKKMLIRCTAEDCNTGILLRWLEISLVSLCGCRGGLFWRWWCTFWWGIKILLFSNFFYELFGCRGMWEKTIRKFRT